MDKDQILKKIDELKDLILLEALCEELSLYTDPDIGLMWSRSSESAMTWDEAFEYAADCADGGHIDWRLPTRSELISLIDDTRYEPACKDNNMKNFRYWSSTSSASDSNRAWSVHFYYGDVNSYDKSNCAYVRCVRTVQTT